MTITTTAPVQTTPYAARLTILNDAAQASGIERGIIAAGILERMVPTGVQIEEHDLGGKRTTRGVFLHEGGVDQIAMYFLDGTAEVSVHIDRGDHEENFDRFVTPSEMFDLVRDYYAA